jgi:hypothetical protein
MTTIRLDNALRGLAAVGTAAVVPAACGGEPSTEPTPEPTGEPTVTVEVFFSNEDMGDPCGEVFGVPRVVDADDPATGALVALFAGPTAAEVEQGYGGWFSARTEGMLRSLRVEEGTARADFEDLRSDIPNASTSCGSQGLLAQLDSTLLQFPEISDTPSRSMARRPPSTSGCNWRLPRPRPPRRLRPAARRRGERTSRTAATPPTCTASTWPDAP